MSTIDNTHVKRSRYPYLVDEIGDACASPVDGGKVEGYIHALEPKIRGCRGCGEAMLYANAPIYMLLQLTFCWS